jgi:hypothetical protein
MTFQARRLWSLAAAIVAGGLLFALLRLHDIALRDQSFLSGWLLFSCLLFLALFNARKNLPVLPLLRASVWLQAHIYVGLVAILLFLLHSRFRLPDGPFEIFLWLLFAAEATSGLVGLAFSRMLAPRLAMHGDGERVIFERIPLLRAHLAREVEELAGRSVIDTRSVALVQYYASRLEPFFRRPRNFLRHLLQSSEPLRAQQREMAALRRYLDEPGRATLREIEERVVAKDSLDYQYSLHLVLKGWLFVHIPLTYGLLLAVLAHLVLVYAFTSGTL